MSTTKTFDPGKKVSVEQDEVKLQGQKWSIAIAKNRVRLVNEKWTG